MCKSGCADTLHRFCKKEHDWGWKKFMELNKVLEGFTVSNTLVIKAQVQVIRSVCLQLCSFIHKRITRPVKVLSTDQGWIQLRGAIS